MWAWIKKLLGIGIAVYEEKNDNEITEALVDVVEEVIDSVGEEVTVDETAE